MNDFYLVLMNTKYQKNIERAQRATTAISIYVYHSMLRVL